MGIIKHTLALFCSRRPSRISLDHLMEIEEGRGRTRKVKPIRIVIDAPPVSLNPVRIAASKREIQYKSARPVRPKVAKLNSKRTCKKATEHSRFKSELIGY